MTETSFEVGFDGARYVLRSSADGAVRTARLTAGTHTDQEHDVAVASLRNGYATLRTWATDAATVNTNWPNMTAAQKDAAMRTTIQRLGLFLDRFGDLLQALNADA